MMHFDADKMLARCDALQVALDDLRADLRRTGEGGGEGPEVVSTTWCEQHLGYSARQWRSWCEAGEIPEARKDASGRWRLPPAHARQHFDRVLQGGTVTPSRPAATQKKPRGRTGARDPQVTPIDRRARRGGWKAKTRRTPAGGAS